MNYPVVRVIIPTFNCAEELDATVESVLAQDYEDVKVFIAFVDFGSTDGTQEKLLHYRQKQTGIYSLAGKRIGRTMIADAARMYDYQRRGHREFLLWPGDIIYPHCFKTAEYWLNLANQEKGFTSLLVAEVDIRGRDNEVHKQRPLFTGACHLRAHSLDSCEYAKRGYKHRILSYGHGFSCDYTKGETQCNQRYTWNQLAYLGLVVNTVYIDEALGCLKEREYDDELDEIIFLFEAGLTCFRIVNERPEDVVISDDFENEYRTQLAHYSLWRSFHLYKKNQHKEAEDCFLFARVIWPEIYIEKCWKVMEELIKQGNEAAQVWLTEYFNQEDNPAKPKWPIAPVRPGLFGFVQSTWRIIYNKMLQRFRCDNKTAWAD